MNPLTLVKRIQSINSKEATLGISEEASWHAKYKDSAYVFVGGIPFELTEGDLLAVFAQYGEVVDVNLVRDKGTGKSKGFAFLAYEDQRSTILAVDNLNGAQVSGRTIRVDHVSNYKKKEEEDEEAEQQKREARGVCRAFQRGECTRGAGCKFSHDEQRAANTGWGAEDNKKWGHDRFEAPKKTEKRLGNMPPFREPEPSFRARTNERASEDYHKNGDKKVQKRSGRYNDDEFEPKPRADRHRAEEKRGRRYDDGDELELKPRKDHDRREQKRAGRYNDDDFEPKSREEKRGRRYDDGDDLEPKPREDRDSREQKKSRRHDDRGSPEIHRREEKRPGRHDDHSFESKSREDRDEREGKRPRRPESESYTREDRDKRGRDKQVANDRDSFSQRHRER